MVRRVAWWVLMVVLVGTLLRIWHMVLLKLDLRPFGLSGWLLLAAACLGLALALERGVAGGTGREVPGLWRRCSRECWALLALLAVLLMLFNTGFTRASSDGRGYFAQTRSIMVDHDLDFANDIAEFAARETDAHFPVGTALLWTPFHALADGWLALLELTGAEHSRGGLSNPYQRAVGLGTLLYGVAAIGMIGAALRRYFGRAPSLVAVGTIVLATPVVWYLAVDASMSHGVSLFAVTAFLFLWLKVREGARGLKLWLLAGATVAMVLVRPQNALFMVVPATDLAVDIWRRGLRGSQPQQRAPSRRTLVVLLLGTALAVAVLIPLLGPAALRYVELQGLFQEFSPVQLLFSPMHGLISSSPVVAVALLGLPFVLRHDRALGIGLCLAVVLQVVLNSATAGWGGGASFGSRRFVSCALPFAFGLAAAIQEGRRRPMVPIVVLLGGFVYLNLTLVDEVRRGGVNLSEPLPFARMVTSVTDRVGNPFALPGALVFAWRHDVPVAFLDTASTRRHTRLNLDVGAQEDERYLVGAWFDRELGGGRSFRWASTPEAGLLARFREDSYRLSFVAAPFPVPGVGPQTVEVWVEGELEATFELTEGFARYETLLSAGALPERDWARVSFRFAHAGSPADSGLSDDVRELAVQFDSIRLEPLGGS